MNLSISTNLSYTDITGEVPPQLGNLSRLVILDLSSYLGGLYSGGLSWLTGLSSLEYLDLGMVNLNASVGWARAVNMLLSLRVLALSDCGLTTSASSPEPARANLTRLQRLDLSYNGINTSTVDAWFWDVPTLTYLDLSGSSLSSPFPDALDNITGLQVLNLKGNNMAGMIPAALQPLCSLQEVDVTVNHINGDMSEFMDRLPRCALRNLQVLQLLVANMSGQLPERIGDISELAYLDLSYNNLAGEIPQGIGRLSELTRLFLLKNRLNGSLSEAHIADLASLEWIDLSQNSMSMKISPRCRSPCRLVYAYFPDVKMVAGSLHGSSTSQTSKHVLRDRAGVDREEVAIFDAFAVEIQHVGDLQLLDLADNRISGSIPPSLGNMTGMTQEHTPLALNPLAGYGASGNDRIVDSLPIVTKGQVRDYTSRMIYMVSLDLSDNVLGGEIPEELPSLIGLVSLNLSRNHLTGTIPQKIGSIKILESLDMSMNAISGAIPSSLSDLTSLCYLNLSYNNLSGRIPSGNQLQALANPAYFYIGNAGFCGPPLSKNCSSGDNSGQAPLHGDKGLSNMTFFYLGLAVGFVVGLWLVFCSLLFVKTWRYAYFRAIDKAYDIVYVFVAVRLTRHREKEATMD
ncbi:LRR receptor-like serine/threonine-protein kinase RGI5 [Phragmites australis]|uniref:LRR receptor-like serine/threonine-protein kinase RGI5 n=1 Tax=Phragmites australis TaxID=29695 RepID=UPI002D7A2D3A|nr:LRR receptor-like serine/threonine-protein kinase RGI5 [Phragmites australis]